jgi:predicted nuclease of predicted toxin-antitoxin system
VADENIPKDLVYKLRDLGIDVLWINETKYRGNKDIALLQLAVRTHRVMLTKDKDFLLLEIRKLAISAGVIHIAVSVSSRNCNEIAAMVIAAMSSARGHIISINEDEILKY